jgi:endonuclease YncB( thermonuclease family)
MSVGNFHLKKLPKLLSLATITLLLALTAPASADDVHIVGVPGITDGDTIRIGTDRIRLHGIDAPERHQQCGGDDGQPYACGQVATRALADFVNGREVDCRVMDTDRYGRAVAVCLVGGVDINGWLVTNGWAVAYTKYSLDYVDEEEAARQAKAGLWSGDFQWPWEWRKAN